MGTASPEEDLDPRVLAQLRELQSFEEPHLVAELIDSFLASAPELLEQLQRRSERGELREVELGAHRLLGLCGSLGVKRMMRLCGRLEDLARCGDRAEVASHLTALERVFQSARERLMAERAKESLPTRP